ncbi:ABC transporter ATP-binding protein [Glycomyces harbinensis]|uniref:ABC-2 type transport system ATP-binding protein n=1 Tax=Glycomyces harbinensis TaxID=58114 RepID=A0A1G6XRE1_9ACTN|nr:ABC transporter ATP-binding protein [Glycomyces harbinensis]SDD79896.1 ABC-2 type transport system ATP-binding protein [Glycomyces harbinensis]
MAERLAITDAVREYSADAGVLGASLHVAAGEVHALIGLNGAGKTTLMRAVLGMVRLDSGTVRIGGVPLDRVPTAAWSRVGHLIDHPFAYPDIDTRSNLAIAARLRTVPHGEVAATVEAALEYWGLAPYTAVRAATLSKGNRQRLGLAAAFVAGPDLAVLDEPTDGLDPAGVIALREALRDHADRGAGVLVSSHHLDEVARFADRISVMNHGRIIAALDPAGTDLEREFFALLLDDDAQRDLEAQA